MRRSGCGTGHSRVTELSRPRDAIGASDRDAGQPVATSIQVARGSREMAEAGQVALPGLVGAWEDQAAVWVKRRPKVQLVPWSA
jgi:hypothetical protein